MAARSKRPTVTGNKRRSAARGKVAKAAARKKKSNTKAPAGLRTGGAPRISPAVVAAHGLKPDEYERIRQLIGRAPSLTELGIFSAMWNEHCSYKSSKIHPRTMPTQTPWVNQRH